jgi:hypothetical protein
LELPAQLLRNVMKLGIDGLRDALGGLWVV